MVLATLPAMTAVLVIIKVRADTERILTFNKLRYCQNECFEDLHTP